MGPRHFTFPTFSAYFVVSGSRLADSRWLPAPHYHRYPLLRYIRDVACAGVTSRIVGCAMKTRRSERNARVYENGNLMRREGSD